jgi:hypothetical protein
LLALFMGFVASLVLATERFGLFYWGAVEGRPAIAIGYVLASAACFGLYVYIRPQEKLIKQHLEVLLPFSALYSVALATPFYLDRLIRNPRLAALILIGTPIIVLLSGHRFHTRIRGLAKNDARGRRDPSCVH